APTVKEAQQFLERANDRLLELAVDFSVADWIRATYITDDTDHMAAKLNDRLMSANAQMAKEAARFNGLKLAPDTARQIKLLKLSLTAAPPADRKASAELAQLLAELEGIYGKGKYCPEDGKPCQDLGDLSRILARSRNPKELEAAWKGWHAIAKPIREHYIRFVQLSNQGAKELGFADTGAMWRSKYDMTPDAYAKEVDRLWEQVKPLYMSLHTYVRWKLREKYGDAVVPAKGPIPAHLLGNMWAQEWGALYPELAPKNADPGYDLTKILNERKVDAKQMVRYGEQFFSSLGFDPLPPTFWTRSQFVKPRDREVVCHASAWDVDFNEDIRIKMCIEINDEDFTTVHHELGHNYYQREYRKLPFLYRDSANDGFHEAIGDTVALSVTPEYLVKIGLLDKAPPQDKDIGLLLKRALDKVAFLPFGLLVDKWRWQVFSGAVPPAKYNEAWWNLRKQYQGVAPPVERTEADFDPGAKYHVPGNTPYSRYFLAAILQFQMHRGLSQIAGCKDALHRCSIYENKAAGAKLKQMLGMGASKPWPEALAVVTNGQKQMDATAIVDYFAPLKKWLDEQNQGKPTGWD
ncbi:MAG: M2 family metallopeptidase, partial [Acidobacteria bacterium]|nr:M2 family metallopeptidase [Acidobacteriota bacterium]